MASASSFLSSSGTFSACEMLKTSSVCFNPHQFRHSIFRNKASYFIFIPQVSIPEKLKTSSVGFNLQQPGHSTVWRSSRTILHASLYNLNGFGSASSESHEDSVYVPKPIVVIVQDFNVDVTIVKLSFGDRLGELIDTLEDLRGLGLDVLKGTVSTEGSVKHTPFLIKQLETGQKVEDPEMFEKIRLTIITNLLKYHPESSENLAMGEAFGEKPSNMKLYVDIARVLYVKDDGPLRSLVYIETEDRPGLLVEIIQELGQHDFNVKAAEIVTEGFVAKFMSATEDKQ